MATLVSIAGPMLMLPLLLLLLATSLNAQSSSDRLKVVDPDSQPNRVDYVLLQAFCQRQDVTTQCPSGVQYCAGDTECPLRYVCSCGQGCGQLTCMLPPNVQVCTSHPIPRDGFTLNRVNSVEFFCDEGFELSGAQRKTCRQGAWFPADDFPRCVPSFCPADNDLVNGSTMYEPANEKQRYNTTATHRCDIGFTLVGTRVRTCRSDDTWSAPMPECKRDGYWTDFSDWSECDAQCDRGLQTRSRTCVPPEEGARACPERDISEIRVCDTGKQCETARLGCFTQPPWNPDRPVTRVDFTHAQLDRVHRCLHRCRRHGTTYATVHGQMNCWCFDEYRVDGVVPNCQSSSQLYEVFPVPQAVGCYRQVQTVVAEEVPTTIYVRQRFTTKCGWWGWSRCTRFRSIPQPSTITRYRFNTKTVKC
ncbi:complement receptor type 2-like isoform X1 [Sycon ciliatum]|uniref:complement receptor type 2-like isoform X1 n=1 Tax=Sycon ciliatum TaxID=27933 RepID=UPI0031F70087